MGQPLSPRIIRPGPLKATSARSGNVGDNTALRMNNLMLRGRDPNRQIWEVFGGLGDVGEDAVMVAMTGTLDLVAGSTEIVGTGTLFTVEAHLGQRICAIPSDNSASWLLVPEAITDDTHMTVWKAPISSAVGVTGWRMPRLFSVNELRGTCLTGNVLKLDKGSFLGVGSGIFRLNGQPLPGTSMTLTRHPQLALYDATASTYTVFPLGMATPVGVTAAAVGGGTKGMQGGNYSLVVQAARKETGGYNLASLRVDVTIATNDMVEVTLPAMDTANGQDAWRISVTQFAQSLGANLAYLNGPWFFYQPAGAAPNVTCTDIDVSPAGGTFTIEWLDAEIISNDTVDFTIPDDPPVDAEFVELLNANITYVSCQGQGNVLNPTATSPGPFIVSSKPNNIEAAPLGLSFSSSPPETILGAVMAQGRIYLLTVNKLQIAQSTPSDIVPTLIRPYWHDGFANPDQLVFVNGTLYGYPVAGPSKSAGDGDETYVERDWAADVFELMQFWNAGQVMVGFDPFNDAVIFFHLADRRNVAGFWTTKWLAYGIPQQAWIGAGEFTDNARDRIVCGVATIGDRMQLLLGGRTTV